MVATLLPSTALPQGDGYLPYMLTLLTAMGLTHTAVCYLYPPSISLTQFSGPRRPPPNGLTARLYGFKNIYTSLIRLYAAYNITNRPLYTLAMLTLAGVILLNGSEFLVFRTARAKECIAALVVPSATLLWMVGQREFYLGA